MEPLLLSLHKGPDNFLSEVQNYEDFDDLTLGCLMGINQSRIKSELQFLNVLWKVWTKGKTLEGLVLVKFLQVLKDVIKGINKKKPIYILKDLLENLEKVGLEIRNSKQIDQKFIEGLIEQYSLCYAGMINIYSDTYEIIRLLKLGKIFSDLIPQADIFLTIEEMNNLENIIDGEDIIPGCVVLNKICQTFHDTQDSVLYKFLINILVYLMEIKAQSSHIRHIVDYLNYFADVFYEDSKVLIINSYKVLCNKYQVVLDPQMIENFEVSKNSENTLENEKLKNQKPPKKNQKKEDKNPTKDENKKYEADQRNKKYAGDQLNSNLISTNNQNSNPNALPNQKKELDSKIPLEKAIEHIIEEGIYLYEEKQKLDPGEFLDMFMALDFKDQPNKLFFKLDELMAKGKPNAVKAGFWKLMLKIIDKLPIIDRLEMDGLRQKLRAMKGNVRDNKEKVSFKKENKAIYKEQLKKVDKYDKNFKGGDREQKRSQKPKTEDKPSVEFDTLSAFISKLSQDALELIRECVLDQNAFMSINSQLTTIIRILQSVSGSSTLRVIGSAGIGTCLKNSSIDLALVDKLNTSPEIITKAFPDIQKLSEDVYELQRDNCTFKIHAGNLLYLEISALLKKYCLVDTRINELIIFIKLWGRGNGLHYISGFHWTLLAINFLQNTEPPVVSSLQMKDHKEKIVGGVDVWFDLEYSQPSSNCCSLGQLIYFFFSHYNMNSNIVADIKNIKGGTHESKYIVLHPFTGSEIGRDLTEQQNQKLQNTIAATFEMLVNGEEVSKLLRINK
jgi:predicted transcriptional regulator